MRKGKSPVFSRLRLNPRKTACMAGRLSASACSRVIRYGADGNFTAGRDHDIQMKIQCVLERLSFQLDLVPQWFR